MATKIAQKIYFSKFLSKLFRPYRSKSFRGFEQIETDLNEMKRREALLNTRANQKNAADNTFFIFYILLQRISK